MFEPCILKMTVYTLSRDIPVTVIANLIGVSPSVEHRCFWVCFHRPDQSCSRSIQTPTIFWLWDTISKSLASWPWRQLHLQELRSGTEVKFCLPQCLISAHSPGCRVASDNNHVVWPFATEVVPFPHKLGVSIRPISSCSLPSDHLSYYSPLQPAVVDRYGSSHHTWNSMQKVQVVKCRLERRTPDAGLKRGLGGAQAGGGGCLGRQ